MRVLFVGFVWPEPKSSAAGQNILSYMQACKNQQWSVWFCSGAEQGPQTEDLAALGIDTFQAQLNHSSFDKKVAEVEPDIVIFDRFLSFEQFAWRVKAVCPDAMLVLDAEDIHGLRHARHTLVKQANEPGSLLPAIEIFDTKHHDILFNDIMLRELSCIYQADLTIVLSSAEYTLLNDVFNVPVHQLSHCPFIVSKSTVIPLSFSNKCDFAFIGNFRHAPNYHSAKVLREQVWPNIYKTIKQRYGHEVSCHVYGAYLSPKAKQLENKNLQFFVHGFADNQFEVINNARVMVAPIAFGAGVKGKFLDAMQCNTPSVTSSIGAEGISTMPWGGFIQDDIQTLIDQSISLYNDQQIWSQAVKRGNAIIDTDYNTANNTKRFISCIETTYQNLTINRSKSFMQKMLSKQQFQSSKYMSQWIEAKNK